MAGVSIDTYLSFGGAAPSLTRKSLRATLALTEGRHHLASITTIQGDVDKMMSATSLAAIMNVEANGEHVALQGYLDTGGVARQSGTGDNTLRVMGVTSTMRAGTARAWAKAKPSTIAIEVAAPYKLGLEFDYYDGVLDFFSQSESESDWQTLVRLAERIGFSVVNDGPLIRFVDVAQELRRAASVGYVTLVLPSIGASKTNITRFQLLTSTTPSGSEYRNWKMSGTDGLRQRFNYEVSYERGAADIEPEFDAVHSGTFTSLGQAVIEARKSRRQARWTQTAKVGCTGYRDLRPGRHALLVDREGAFGGFWYVTDVLHTFDNVKNLSATEATLCRASQTSTMRHVAVDPARPPGLQLIGGKWQCDRFWQKVA